MKFFSYIDPGTGSLFFQMLIGALLGGIVVFRKVFTLVFYKVKNLIKRQEVTEED